MKLLVYQNPRTFQERVTPFLLEHEAENNLPLGILANLIAGEFQDQPPYLAAVEQQGSLTWMVICTPPYPVLFSFREALPPEEEMDLVLADLQETYGRELTGITADQALTSLLVPRWVARTGVEAELKMAMRIYQLNRVQPVTGVPGELRSANKEDSPLMQAWYGNFLREALGEDPDPKKVERQVERYLAGKPHQRGLVFWAREGKRVSMAGYSGPTPHGIRVGAVYTPPERRRKGFASACVAALSRKLLGEGFEFCFLFTDLLNPTSNHIYQEIGYRPVSDVDSCHFEAPGSSPG